MSNIIYYKRFKGDVVMITLEDVRDSSITDSAKIDILYRIANYLLSEDDMSDTYITNIFRYAENLINK